MGWVLMRVGAIAGTALVLGACAGAPPPPARVPLDIVQREVGPDLAARPRPSDGRVELSLFIDAGARDADPPQVAAIAIQLAAERAGEGVTGRAWPDGSELTMGCRSSEAAACVMRLSRGLAARAPSAAEVERIVNRLADTRRAARAADPASAADRLALAAALGESTAAGLFPLGQSHQDTATTAEKVAAFLAAHYGPRRALLVAAGDLSVEQLSTAATHAFTQNPAARAQRTPRGALDPQSVAAVAVEIDEIDALSLALIAPDAERAALAANAVRAGLLRGRLARHVRGHVFPLRGGAVALLRVDSGRHEEVLIAGAHALTLMQLEASDTALAASADDTLPALLHQAGLRWFSRGEGPWSGGLSLGAGLLAIGGRADHPGADDPDAAQRQSLTQRMQAALAAGKAAAEPELDGSIDDEGADVTLKNGAHIVVRARSGERVAVAVRFAGGAADDPPLQHGRAALLATATTSACAGRGPGSLAETLEGLGAQLEARVDSSSWGFVLTAPAAQAAAAARLAIECALDPWLARRHVTTARARARARLGGSEGVLELQARAAEALAAEAPGRLAPWGSTDGLANTSLDALDGALQQAMSGSALSVGVVGPVQPDAVVGLIARRVALLPSTVGDAASPAGSATIPASPGTAAPPADLLQPSFALLLWKAQSPSAHPAGARAFAALMRDGLARIPAVEAPWYDGGLLPGGGWAAVAVVADAATLFALRDGVDAAAAAIDQTRLGNASAHAHARYEAAAASARARASGEADALARRPLEEPADGPGDAAAARALARALSRSGAHFFPLR